MMKKLSFVLKIVFLILFVMIMGYLIYYSLSEYHSHFKEFPRSNEPAVWGAFGDYIGGVLNPIIAFASFIVLAYISVQVGKDSAKEKHKYFIIENRINAFQDLCSKLILFKNQTAKVSTTFAIVESNKGKLVENIKIHRLAVIEYYNLYKIFCRLPHKCRLPLFRTP